MRVENVKGAVWTVDEIEFYKRRPQRCTGNNIGGSNSSIASNFSRNHDLNSNYDKVSMAVSSAAISAAVFQSNHKSQSVIATPSPSLPSAVAVAAALHLKNAAGFPHHASVTSSPSTVGYVTN